MKGRKIAALFCATIIGCFCLTACNNADTVEKENGKGQVNAPTEVTEITPTEAPMASPTDMPTVAPTEIPIENAEVESMIIFRGESKIDAPWTSGVTVFTTNTDSGTFDAATIAEGGCIAVKYTGTRAQVYLAFQDKVNWSWKSVNTPTMTEKTEQGFVSYFSFADCSAAYGSGDFSDLGSFTVGTTQSTEPVVITSIEWGIMPEEEKNAGNNS